MAYDDTFEIISGKDEDGKEICVEVERENNCVISITANGHKVDTFDLNGNVMQKGKKITQEARDQLLLAMRMEIFRREGQL